MHAPPHENAFKCRSSCAGTGVAKPPSSMQITLLAIQQQPGCRSLFRCGGCRQAAPAVSQWDLADLISPMSQALNEAKTLEHTLKVRMRGRQHSMLGVHVVLTAIASNPQNVPTSLQSHTQWLRQLQPPAHEVIVVDGNSEDRCTVLCCCAAHRWWLCGKDMHTSAALLHEIEIGSDVNPARPKWRGLPAPP